jgi:hypothetical protein
LCQAIYGRLAGYGDVNDAERLARDPAMRAIVGRVGLDRLGASTSEMGWTPATHADYTRIHVNPPASAPGLRSTA